MELILAIHELTGDVTLQDMYMIANINRIILNLKFMNKLLKQ